MRVIIWFTWINFGNSSTCILYTYNYKIEWEMLFISIIEPMIIKVSLSVGIFGKVCPKISFGFYLLEDKQMFKCGEVW